MRGPLHASLLAAGLVSAAAAAPAGAAPGPQLKEPNAALERALECTPTVGDAKVTPVLLVHGTTSTPEDNWSWNYRLVLPKEGYPTCTLRLPGRALGDMQRAVEYVVFAIRRVADRARRQIAVVGHSQGGFLPTLALRYWPDLAFKIDDYIGLAPALGRGTAFADIACGGPCAPAFWQFRPRSKLLEGYNRRELPPGPSYTSIFTLFDQAVVPQPQASTLRAPRGVDTTSVAVQDFCGYPRTVEHVLLVGDAVAYALLIDALTHPGPADPDRVPLDACTQVAMPGADDISFLTAVPRFMAGVAEATVSDQRVEREPALRCYLDPACPKPRLHPTLDLTSTVAREGRGRIAVVTSGELELPEGATNPCTGSITVRVQRARRTISTRRAALSRDCLFSSRAVIRRPRRSLRAVVRFGGSDELVPVRAHVAAR